MPTWLVTGGSGFLGQHLLARLMRDRPAGARVVAVGRRPLPLWTGDSFVMVDLDQPPSVQQVVADIAPDIVIHLAGRTPPTTPEAFYRSNAMATVHLLDALRASGRPCRVVLAGSAAELGPVPVEDLPVGEDYPCRPAGAYGLSKWLASAAGLAAGPPLEVVVARIFNPIGAGLPRSQALGRYADELASGEGLLRLAVGDLDARRDFVDARDVAEALMTLAILGDPGRVYHVGRGVSHRVGDGLDFLISLSRRAVILEVDPDLVRHWGPDDSRADVRRIQEETGWSARITWEQSLCGLWVGALGRAWRG